MNTGFQGAPEKLFNKPVKITNYNLTRGFFGMGPRQGGEAFYSIKDGNWNDPTIWETVSGRIGKIPSLTGTDDVYIKTNVTCSITDFGSSPAKTNTINNLFIGTNASLINTSGNSSLFIILGNLQCLGLLDCSASNVTFNLYGTNNYINSFTKGTSTIQYQALTDQPIMNLDYYNLSINGGGNKSPSSNISVSNNLSTSGTTFVNASTLYINFSSYDLTVGGTTTLTSTFFWKSGGGNLLFTGLLTVNAGTFNLSNGNPTVELRGGFTYSGNPITPFNSGTGTWNFTTNSQNTTFSNPNTYQFDASLVVATGITVTNVSASGIMQINGSLGGASATGNFTNKGTLYWNNSSSYTYANGTFDKDTFNTNVVGYIFNGSATLPYTTYQGLVIRGTGTKTAGGNTTISTTLNIDVNGFFELSTFNLTVTGATGVNGVTTGSATLSKTGAGSILFGGLLTAGGAAGSTIDFSGNPTIEMRGGMTLGGNNVTWTSGTGTWTFTTNNQNVTIGTNNNATGVAMNGAIVISGAITVTNLSSTKPWLINVSIDGTVAGSTLVNQGYLYFGSTTAPMNTGVFTRTASTNTIGYVMNGNYTIPYTSYQGLVIGGTGITGLKTLSGNTTVDQNFSVGATSTSFADGIELSTFDFTVTGTTTIFGLFSKNGAGNILFVGIVNYSGITTTAFNLTGNPSVELRGGITMNAAAHGTTGTGTWTFTTNNQTISGGGSFTFASNLLISGAITITQSHAGLTLTGTLNGNNASSTFDNRGTFNYQNSAAPMITGVLKANVAVNTILYNLAGAQDVQGGNTHLTSHQYWHLNLSGSGTKTLQGDVSVLNTYTLGGTATKNNNGFTFGNP